MRLLVFIPKRKRTTERTLKATNQYGYCSVLPEVTNFKFYLLLFIIIYLFITLEEGKIDLKDNVAVEHVLGKIRPNSGFVMCPGIVDYDAIISDIRFQPSNVKGERWPWRHVGAMKCRLWHKPHKQQSNEENISESVLCAECRLARRQMLVLCDRRRSLEESKTIDSKDKR